MKHFQTRKAIMTGQKLDTCRNPVRVQFALARSCQAECASAAFLEGNGAPFTLTPRGSRSRY